MVLSVLYYDGKNNYFLKMQEKISLYEKNSHSATPAQPPKEVVKLISEN